MKYIVIKIRN